jgi:tight adherence protein B
VVVLSDGGDTVSDATLGSVRSRLERLGTPVYAVALKSNEYNPRALELLTASTQGRLVPASDSQSLTKLFEGIAQEITSAWSVTYESRHPRTADIDVDIVAQAGDVRATAATAYKNPSVAAASTAPVHFPKVTDNLPLLGATAVLAMLAVTLLVSGILLITLRERNTLTQLHFYDQLHEVSDHTAPSGTSGVRAAIVDAVDTVAGKRGLTQLASSKLESAGLPLRASEYMTMHLLLVVGLGVLTQLLTGNFALSILLIGAATVGPLIAIDQAVDKRRRRFEEQLPDILTMIAGSLRGGWGIQQAIGLAAQEAAAPAGPELKRVETETRLGMALERSLQLMADRMGSPDFHAAVGAIAVQREVGGNLAQVLDLVAKTVREREAMRRQIKALTSEGRLSAWILIALPFFVLAILLVTSPAYLVPLFMTPAGIALLTLGVLLMIIGSIWMYRVTKIEV